MAQQDVRLGALSVTTFLFAGCGAGAAHRRPRDFVTLECTRRERAAAGPPHLTAKCLVRPEHVQLMKARPPTATNPPPRKRTAQDLPSGCRRCLPPTASMRQAHRRRAQALVAPLCFPHPPSGRRRNNSNIHAGGGRRQHQLTQRSALARIPLPFSRAPLTHRRGRALAESVRAPALLQERAHARIVAQPLRAHPHALPPRGTR